MSACEVRQGANIINNMTARFVVHGVDDYAEIVRD